MRLHAAKSHFLLTTLAAIAAAWILMASPAEAQTGSSGGNAPSSAQPGSPPKLPQGLSEDELNVLLGDQLPFTPAQTKKIKKAALDAEEASKARVDTNPHPTMGPLTVHLDSGARIQVIRVAANYSTSLIFSDVTGAPWPLVDVIAAQRGQLDIPEAAKGEDGKLKQETNQITLVPLVDVVRTQITVKLAKAPAPIILIVASGQSEVDVRRDISVQARGPGAVMPTLARGTTESVPVELTNMVAGLTPPDATSLKVISSDVPDVRAWARGQRMYVRTKAQVLSPPVPKDGKVASGPEGTKVFELPLSPVVLLMQGGSVGQLKLGGFPAPFASRDKAGDN